MSEAGNASRALTSGAQADGVAGFRIAVEDVSREIAFKKLPIGSTLTARILTSHGQGRYTVGIAGMKLIAESSLSLPVGARVAALVTAHEPRIHLRLLKPDDAAIGRVLKQLGFNQPQPDLKEIIAEMMRQDLPLTRQGVKNALDAMQHGLSARQAARMIAHDVPLGALNEARARAAEGSVAHALDRLTTALQDAGRSDSAQAVRDALTFRGDLGELFASHPLKFERRLLAGDIHADRREIKPMLVELAQADTATGASKELVAAADAARELLEVMDGRYLVGNPEREIPFVVEDNGSQDASLWAERAAGRTHVGVRLDTSRLGSVVGIVDIVNRTTGIALGVTSPEARRALVAAAPELIERLQALGLRVDGLTIDVVDRKDGAQPTPRPPLGLDIQA